MVVAAFVTRLDRRRQRMFRRSPPSSQYLERIQAVDEVAWLARCDRLRLEKPCPSMRNVQR